MTSAVPWWAGLIVFTGLMLMNGAFLVQFHDVDQLAGAFGDMFAVIGEKESSQSSMTAFILTYHIFSTAFIALEITGLCLFLFPCLIIFWKTPLLEKHGSGYWVLAFMGILFWHVAFFALRSMNANSRRSLILAGTGGQQQVSFDMHEIDNAWTVYMVTVVISLLLIIVSIILKKEFFMGKFFGKPKSSRKWKVWTLKIASCISTILCGLSVVIGVYTENFLASSWIMASGMGLGIGIYSGYTTVRILSMRKKHGGVRVGDDEEEEQLLASGEIEKIE